MLARVPWKPVQQDKPKPKRLSGDRRRQLVETTAKVLRDGEPTPFAFEATCRHGLRSALCWQGWSWKEADEAAADIVATALKRIGARRPTWMEGQPDHCQPGVMALARTRCVRCGNKLPEAHDKWCGAVCKARAFQERASEDELAARNARKRAHEAAWSAKQPMQPCELCGAMFRPKKPGRRFCSRLCSNRNNSGLGSVPERYSHD